MAKSKGFFGLGWLITLILVIFAPFGWICGTIERLLRGKILGAIVNLLGYGIGILWICDIVTLILSHDIKVLA
ncbi:hypothetical protein FACS1894211_10850 [Clostridia bacterium]|nr:hypothetical protein FACS1894211_10850 [Clostridia bacterium]